MNTLTKSEFINDVKNHKMIVVMDSGVYRHIHFSDGTFIQHFDIVTYPQYLVISGDMGCYAFSRVNDMFDFFRGKKINPAYWGEKLQAGNAKTFDYEIVMSSINKHIDSFCEDIGDYFDPTCDYADEQELEHYFREEVAEHFAYSEMDEFRFISTIDSFESSVIPDVNIFEDMGSWLEHESFYYRYLWCCHAIVWAIAEYDKSKNMV